MPGISGFAVYVPPRRVHLADWCAWRDQPWDKVGRVVGDSFRVCGPEQDVYALAASAALRLIDAYGIDPRDVGQLILGTESASDNAAGAVIVRGMLDAALTDRGDAPLARDCEVPEIKHACLGGVYALKQAARYLTADGAGRQAIVISADIAEYAPGSSGEPTQGAGAVAMLLESDAALLNIDLAGGAGASAYRALDFRKPFARFAGQAAVGARLHDYPVFNGRYSTACYFDSVRHAMDGLRRRRSLSWRDALAGWDAVFLHRPYARMPETAWGLLWLHALAVDGDAEFDALCAQAELSPAAVRSELAADADLDTLVAGGRLDSELYPQAQMLLRAWRGSAGYRMRVTEPLGPGAELMRALGNLYTAALPAWLAAGLNAAAREDDEPAGERWLALGYGSGDAAEAVPLTVALGWREAADRIDLETVLDGAIPLNAADYESLHDARVTAPDPTVLRDAFVIEDVGTRDEPHWADAGVARYGYRHRA